MATRQIEAKLIISGEDRASAIIDKVIAAEKRFAQQSDMSATLKRNADAAAATERAFEAVARAIGNRDAFAKAQANAQAAEASLASYARAVETARQAQVAFGSAKPKRGTEEAAQLKAVTNTLREATTAHSRAQHEVERTAKAVRIEAAAMKEADAAAVHLGADLNDLAAHQSRLRSAFESTTAAISREVAMTDRAAAATKRHAHEQAEAARHARQHGLIGAAGAVATGAVGVHGVTHVIEHTFKAGAEVQSTRVDMAKAGIKFDERQHITDESLRLATQYKNVTQAGVMELWKEMRSVMTDPHEVDHVIDPLVRAKSLLDAKDKSGKASENLNMLVKGAEAIGAAKDPERLTHLIDGYVKAMQVMGKTITPESIYEFDKYSKLAGGNLSDRFLLTTAQSLNQELNGSTAGLGMQAIYKQLAGGMQNLHTATKAFVDVGLIKEKDVEHTKTGEVKGVKANVKHAVEGDMLARTDPDKWVYSVLLPHLRAKGITSESDQLAWVQKAFPNSNASATIGKLIQQRESFEAHARMYESAMGLKGVELNRSDPTAGLIAVSKSLETFLGVVSSPIMVNAAHALDDASTVISSATVRLDAWQKEHPDLAKAVAPAAATAGLLGSGAASVAMYKAFSGGFGLNASAVKLDHAALALERAAAVQAGGKVGGGPDGGKKGGKLKGALKVGAGVVGALGLEPLAEFAQEHNIFKVPDLGKDGLGRSALNVLDPNLGNLVLGRNDGEDFDRETRRAREMQRRDAGVPYALPPREHPRMLNAEALTNDDSFARETRRGLEMLRRDGATAGREAGEKTGEGVRSGIETKAPEIETEGRTLWERLKGVLSNPIYVPIALAPGEGMGNGSGIQNASFGGGGSGGGLGGLIHRASLGGSGGFTDGGGGVGNVMRRGGGFGGGGGGGDGLRGGSAFEGARTANQVEAYKAARALGLSDVAARAFVANVSGESIDNPRDFHWDGKHSAEAMVQWDPQRAAWIAQRFGKRPRDMTVAEQTAAALWEMQSRPEYRRSWEALQHGTDGGSILGTLIENYERPQDVGAALAHRLKLLRRFDPNAVADGGDASGLRIKGGLGGQAFGGGGNHPALVGLAEQLQKGGGVNRFTAFNDHYHKGTSSLHARGLATDVTGDPSRIIPNARALMEAQGLVEGRDFRILNEYARPSARATGGHVHIEFRNRGAADAFGKGMPQAPLVKDAPADERPRRPGTPEIPASPASLTIPDAPEGGFGGGGRRDIGAAAERMHAAVDRMEGIGFHGELSVAISGSGRDRARVTRLRNRGRGMTADLGVTMPGAKEADDDWL